MHPEFHRDLAASLPKLRTHALSLTRNRADAEDLVQDAAMNALAAADSFISGTNFGAWMHRILRNRFISNLRKRRPVGDIENAPQSAFAVPGAQEDKLVLGELASALTRLPCDQREALVLVALHGMSYHEVAELTGSAVGTAKSRVFRARRQLEVWLAGETQVSIGVPFVTDDALASDVGLAEPLSSGWDERFAARALDQRVQYARGA